MEKAPILDIAKEKLTEARERLGAYVTARFAGYDSMFDIFEDDEEHLVRGDE